MFYSAAQMVHHRAAHQLYDLDTQHTFQLSYAKRVGLIFDYPAASLLLYLPGTWFPLSTAYLLWTILSTSMLFASSVVLNQRLCWFHHSLLFFFGSFLFLPTWLNLMHGQIVFAVLLAYAFAFYFLTEGRELAGGGALAFGLVKFHLVLPFVLVLMFRRRWRAVIGFLTGAAGFVITCIAVAGWRFLLEYPKLLLRLPSVTDAGTHLSGMANLHGLIVGFTHWDPPIAVLAMISFALLIWSARMWDRPDFPRLGTHNPPAIQRDMPVLAWDCSRGFAIAMVVTVLTSYHLNPHDLSLLLIPLAIAIRNLRLAPWGTAVLASLTLPVSLMLLGPHFWITGISVIGLLLLLATQRPKYSGLPMGLTKASVQIESLE
jgi:hypothetical protein